MLLVRMRLSAAACASVAIFALAVPAHAAPITWQFTGVVRVIQLAGGGGDAPPPDVLANLGVGIGAEMHGSLTWESTTPDTNPDPAAGSYNFAVTAADFAIGGWSVTPLANANNLWVVNDHSGLPTQAVLAIARLSDPSGYSQFETLALELSGQNVTPGDTQPVHAPSLDAIDPFGFDPTSPWGYGSDLLVIGSRCTPSCYLLRAEITSLVPEAGSLAFCALAALALAVRRLA